MMNIYDMITLKTFHSSSEYFLCISALSMLFVTILINYNVLGLIIQQSISSCIGLTLVLTCYLIKNDDLLFYQLINCFNESISEYIDFYIFLEFYKSVVTDTFGLFAKFILFFFSVFYFFIISDFLKNYKLTMFEYLLILLFAVIGLLLLCTNNDLLSSYLAIELVSLSSYLLASFKKNSNYSVEAGIKYLVIGSISSALFLLGSSFIYGSTGSVYMHEFIFKTNQSWIDLLECGCVGNKDFECLEYVELFVQIGLTFILFSLSIKLALAPFHVWSLEVYESSPSISTFFFSVIAKLSFFIFLTRTYYSVVYSTESWQFYAIVISFLSVFAGSFSGLRQKQLKTLLAYSSISHISYTLLSFSTGRQFGIEVLLFYLIIYMLSGITLWFILLLIREKKRYFLNKFNKELGNFALLRKSNPALAISMSVAMFSLASIPPFIGFFVKLSTFLSILYIEFLFIPLLIVLCGVISTFYYIRIIKILYFESVSVGKLYYPIKTNKIIFFTMSVFILLFLFINPTLLYFVIYSIVLKSLR